MASQTDATQDDIRYVRQLAESGAHAPLLGGRYIAWWGLLLTIAYTLQHLALSGRIGDGSTIFAWIWIGFAVLGGAGQFVLLRGKSARPGSGSAGNRASRTVWMTAAAAIMSMVVGAVVADANGAGPATFDWTVPLAFAVYACALTVSGALARDRVARLAGAGAVIMVGLSTSMILSPDRYLIAAAGVALTVLLPGVLMLRAEPR
ncbi:MAG: hypothetical protein QOG72_237 [Sphingomonadales bacterium]|jgi:hypothetical protein|nr:hypothetical protein [Sphingomonadales bacterium]